jgi:lipopolysaccharide export system protein LptC
MTESSMAISMPLEENAERIARARAFVRARRHSRRVRALRYLLPVAGVLAIAGFFVKTHLAFPGAPDLARAGLSVTGSSIIMDQPRLTGFTGDSREYSVAADRAIQPLGNPGEVRLETLEATLLSADRGATKIAAETGDYDHVKNTLRLFGVINIDSAEGYRLTMKDADIDFGAETMTSENPVTIGYENSEITGNRLSISDGGKHIVVEGRVRTTVMPSKEEADPAAATVP